MKGLYTILLLVCSNVFMTFAWYGHLKLQEAKISTHWPLIGVILFSWGIAFFEYSLQIPGNRIGFQGNGGPFTLVQLKVIQEVITLISFSFFTLIFFEGET
ncbi:MAG: DMT family protein, partial [Odoribacter sp.]|nr:DMT family protein [Odoribacter sp.]